MECSGHQWPRSKMPDRYADMDRYVGVDRYAEVLLDRLAERKVATRPPVLLVLLWSAADHRLSNAVRTLYQADGSLDRKTHRETAKNREFRLSAVWLDWLA